MTIAFAAAAQPDASLRQLLSAPASFIELLPVAAYACDAQGRIVWFNRLAASLWGREPRIGDSTELFCGSHRLFFAGRETRREETPMAHAIRTGEAVQGVQGVLERPDGSRVHAMVHILPVKDESGCVLGAINCFHDTSELHEVNSELREKREELEDFFENGAIAMHIVGGDGTILRANRAELAMLGYEASEYIGRPISQFHADADGIAKIIGTLAQGERLDRHPARLKAKDGTVRDVLITSTPRFQNGSFLNTLCFTQDVTEELVAKAKAADSETRYQQLLDSLPAAIYTTDSAGRITYFNRAAVELSGRVPELGTDKWCVTWRLYRPDGTSLPHDQCPMAVAIKENKPVRGVEAVAERPDGTKVPFIPYPTPLRNLRGELVGAVNMLVDISERKQAETSQRILLKELNHRVKNNMQILQSLLTAAHRDTPSVEARTVLSDASGRVAAMAAAQQVLYDGRQATYFNAKDFLTSVCSIAQNSFADTPSIEIEEAAGVLPNDVAVPLALILNELVTNAVKHSGKGRPAIRVGLADEGKNFRLWVKDDGPGFELPNEIGKRSSGLGLVSGLSRQLGGSFSVQRDSGTHCVVQFSQSPIMPQ